MPTCGPFLILSPDMEHWDPRDGGGYVANSLTCGPFLIFSPAVKRWGPATRYGLCSQSAHLWATFDFAPHCEVLGSPQMAGVM